LKRIRSKLKLIECFCFVIFYWSHHWLISLLEWSRYFSNHNDNTAAICLFSISIRKTLIFLLRLLARISFPLFGAVFLYFAGKNFSLPVIRWQACTSPQTKQFTQFFLQLSKVNLFGFYFLVDYAYFANPQSYSRDSSNFMRSSNIWTACDSIQCFWPNRCQLTDICRNCGGFVIEWGSFTLERVVLASGLSVGALNAVIRYSSVLHWLAVTCC